MTHWIQTRPWRWPRQLDRLQPLLLLAAPACYVALVFFQGRVAQDLRLEQHAGAVFSRHLQGAAACHPRLAGLRGHVRRSCSSRYCSLSDWAGAVLGAAGLFAVNTWMAVCVRTSTSSASSGPAGINSHYYWGFDSSGAGGLRPRQDFGRRTRAPAGLGSVRPESGRWTDPIEAARTAFFFRRRLLLRGGAMPSGPRASFEEALRACAGGRRIGARQPRLRRRLKLGAGTHAALEGLRCCASPRIRHWRDAGYGRASALSGLRRHARNAAGTRPTAAPPRRARSGAGLLRGQTLQMLRSPRRISRASYRGARWRRNPTLGLAWMLLGQRQGPSWAEAKRPRPALTARHRTRLRSSTPTATCSPRSGRGAGPAPAPRRAYVRALFDGYADDFENHLVGTLPLIGAHEHVAQGRRFADFGAPQQRRSTSAAATGLCGALLRRRTCGDSWAIDLSTTMVEGGPAAAVSTTRVGAGRTGRGIWQTTTASPRPGRLRRTRSSTSATWLRHSPGVRRRFCKDGRALRVFPSKRRRRHARLCASRRSCVTPTPRAIWRELAAPHHGLHHLQRAAGDLA